MCVEKDGAGTTIDSSFESATEKKLGFRVWGVGFREREKEGCVLKMMVLVQP
jgi:hypothetical protein